MALPSADELEQLPEIDVINEDVMKSDEGKISWREWIMKYEKKVNDYNFGTLLRKNASSDYTEENTILVTRMQQGINKD
ncbi:8262_t:CDS:2 [Diversispora eburnea]|uniref:8262_t:CDS:1 n=1 Tax=Diversispora eburnea TaxID=1213867 RepID=A0A9N8VAN7_9GLOM|nr:8262_t:CDS:2 [Diversispora eburnea]